MDRLTAEFKHHVAFMQHPGIEKSNLVVADSYFSKLKKHPKGIHTCLQIIRNKDNLFDNACMILSSQLIHQILNYGTVGVESEITAHIIDCVQFVLHTGASADNGAAAPMPVYPVAVSTQLLLAISVILSKDIIRRHMANEPAIPLMQMMAAMGQQLLPHAALIKVLSFIPENIKAGRHYTKCNAEKTTAFMVGIYGPLFTEFCSLVPMLFADETPSSSSHFVTNSVSTPNMSLSSVDMLILVCVINWLEVWLDLNEVSCNGLAATVAPDLLSVMSGSLTSRAVDTFSVLLTTAPSDSLDRDASSVDTILNYIGAICEISACCELGVLAVQQIAPLFCQLLQSCCCSSVSLTDLGEESRLHIVFKCLPLWFQPLSGTAVLAEAFPVWCMLLEALISAMKHISFGAAGEFLYYESVFSLMLALLEAFVPEPLSAPITPSTQGGLNLPSMLIGYMQQLLFELILGSAYCLISNGGVVSSMEGEIYQLLVLHRSELRDFTRELLTRMPDVARWLLGLAVDKLSVFVSELEQSGTSCCSQSGWSEVEAVLHCLSACSRSLVADPLALKQLTALVALLSTQVVFCCRPVCILAVVLLAEFIPCTEHLLSSGVKTSAQSVVLLSLLHREQSTKATDWDWDTLPFRTKEDHIGAVSLLKLVNLGFYSPDWNSVMLPSGGFGSSFASEMVINALVLFRDQPLESVWTAFASSLSSEFPTVRSLEMLVCMCYHCTICPSDSQMTWKSTKLVIAAAFHGCALSLRHTCTADGIYLSAGFAYDRLGPLVSLLAFRVDETSAFSGASTGPEASALSHLLSAVQSSSVAVEMSLSLGLAAVVHHSLTEACDALGEALGALFGSWTCMNSNHIVSPSGPALVINNLLFPLLEMLLNKLTVLMENESDALCRLLLACCLPPTGVSDIDSIGRMAQIFCYLLKSQRTSAAVWLKGISSHINIICGTTSGSGVLDASIIRQAVVGYFSQVCDLEREVLLRDAPLVLPAVTSASAVTHICALFEVFAVVVDKVGLVQQAEPHWMTPAALRGIGYVMFGVLEHQYTHSRCDQRKPIWKATVALAMLLIGPIPLDQQGPSQSQGLGDARWLQYLVDCGTAKVLFRCLLLGLVGGIPSPYRNDVVAVLQKYYVALGSIFASEYLTEALNTHPVNLYVKEKRRTELVVSLQGSSSKGDWKKFKDGLKILTRAPKK